MKRFKNFILKHRFYVNLFLSCIVFIGAIKILGISMKLFYEVDPSMKLFLGVFIFIIASKLFSIAFEIQDEAYYQKRFEKTGDDFEKRYDE